MNYDLLGLHFQLGLQTLVERCHLLFLKVCICLLLLLIYIYIYIYIYIHNSTSFHFLVIGYRKGVKFH
jgi:hypothetical protein